MARIGEDRAIFHDLEVRLVEHVDVAGGRAEDVAHGGRFQHRHHAKTVHHSLQGAQRLHLGHDDVGAHATSAVGNTTAAPAIAGHDEVLASQQHVGCADDAINGGLAGAIAVVEKVLGHGVVDGHNRELQRALGRHRAQPDHAGGRLFGAAQDAWQQLGACLVQRGNQVAAIVHRHVGLDVEHRVEVLVVGLVVFAFDGIHRHLVVGDQGRGHIVLRGERVRGAQRHFRATRLQHAHQVGGFGCHMQTGRHAQAAQRLFLAEAGFDQIEDWHFLARPLHPITAPLGQLQVFDVVILRHNLLLVVFSFLDDV